MKKLLYILAGTALLCAGCAKVENETNEVVPEKEAHTVILKATLAENTRVAADAAGVYSWQQGDVITVSIDGSDGFTTAPFRALSAGSTSDFEGAIVNGKLGPYAFYPDCIVPGHAVSRDGVVKFGLGSEYDYKKDVTNMPMMGDITSEGVSFKAVGGLLKVIVYNVPEDAYKFYFTTDKTITGRFEVSETDGNRQINAANNDGQNNSIWFNLFEWDENENLVRLREQNMVFYIPLPVGTYSTFSFGFWGIRNPESTDGETPYEIVTKTATVNGGLTVHRNEIIITPSLNLAPAPTTKTLWSEDFSEYTKDNVPSGNVDHGYNGATVTYSVENGKSITKVYEEDNAGGTSPELLISNGNGVFTVSGIPTAGATSATLTFYENGNRTTISSTTDGITIGAGTFANKVYTCTITIDNGIETFDLVFTNSVSNNVRVDNFVLEALVGTPAIIPTISTQAESATIAKGTLSASIDGVKINNPLDGQGIVATTDADWLDLAFEGSNGFESGKKLKATAKGYWYGTEPRTATVTLKATGATKTVTFVQNASVVDNPTLTAAGTDANFTISWTGDEKAASYVGYYSSNELTDPTTGSPLTITNEGNAFTATPSGTVENGTTYYVYVRVNEVVSNYADKYAPAKGWATAEVTPNATIDYSTTYTSNVTLSTSGGQNVTNATVIIDGTNYPALKAATGKTVGSVRITVPEGKTHLHIHIAAWKDEESTVSITGPTVTTIKPSSSLQLNADSGIKDNSPFTLANDASNYYFDLELTGPSTETRALTFTGVKGKRFVIWGVNAE